MKSSAIVVLILSKVSQTIKYWHFLVDPDKFDRVTLEFDENKHFFV